MFLLHINLATTVWSNYNWMNKEQNLGCDEGNAVMQNLQKGGTFDFWTSLFVINKPFVVNYNNQTIIFVKEKFEVYFDPFTNVYYRVNLLSTQIKITFFTEQNYTMCKIPFQSNLVSSIRLIYCSSVLDTAHMDNYNAIECYFTRSVTVTQRQ